MNIDITDEERKTLLSALDVQVDSMVMRYLDTDKTEYLERASEVVNLMRKLGNDESADTWDEIVNDHIDP